MSSQISAGRRAALGILSRKTKGILDLKKKENPPYSDLSGLVPSRLPFASKNLLRLRTVVRMRVGLDVTPI